MLQKRRGASAGYGATPEQAAPADAAASARNASVFTGARGTVALVSAVALAAVATAQGGSRDGGLLQSWSASTDAAKMSLPSAPLATPKGKKDDYFDDYGDSNVTAGSSSAADYGEAEDGGSTPAGGSINLHFDDYDHDLSLIHI